jgi:general L-amino acid transport system substrate-binding protein
MRNLIAIAAMACGIACPFSAQAGPALDAVRARSELVCGTRGDTMGFARAAQDGRVTGFEADICRAVAVAILGEQARVKFTPLAADRRLPAVAAREVDLLVSGSTLTFARDLDKDVAFPVVYYFDTQGIMVPRQLNKSRATDLGGASICFTSGTTTERNLAAFFERNKLTYKAVPSRTVEERRADFFAGKCNALSADMSALYATRAAYAPNPNDYVVLRDQLSQEPLGIAVRTGDQEFSDIVRWAFFALVYAEENGVGMRNAAELRAGGNARVRFLLGGVPGVGKPLGLEDDWAFNAIKTVGNYGEIFDRNLGVATPLRVFRGLNSLWSQGGMLYSPPFH